VRELGELIWRIASFAGVLVTAAAVTLSAVGTAGASPTASGTATVTIAVSASQVTSGSAVTLSGVVTQAGVPVASTPVFVSVVDAIAGDTSKDVTTNAAGDWSLTVKVTGDLTATANTLDLQSNEATAAVQAVFRATLTIASGVARPWLVDPAKISFAPATYDMGTLLQVRQAGSSAWRTARDSGGVWGTKAGVIYVRAVVLGQPGTVEQGVSSPVRVVVKNGKVPAWLKELNAYRELNDAPPVAENSYWSYGDGLHVRYMEKTGDFSHFEDPKSKWYTKLGALSGETSDLYLGSPDPINGWARAPYHALSELNRSATMAGYSTNGAYSALRTGSVGGPTVPVQLSYQFPASGKVTSLRTYSGGESPDPLSTCPAAWRDSWEVGLPIIFGDQQAVSRPSATVTYPGTSLKVCVVNAGIYGNVVFVIPLLPLKPHHTYTVTVNYNGKRQSRWTFKTS
jgi:hypothetical protein